MSSEGARVVGPAYAPSRLLVVSAIGIAQILSWGSSYYLVAVLATPIAADTGWPLSAVLNEAVGWRGACLAYAAIHLAVVVPLYLLGVPREAAAPPAAKAAAVPAGAVRRDHRLIFGLLAVCLTLSSVIMTVISV